MKVKAKLAMVAGITMLASQLSMAAPNIVKLTKPGAINSGAPGLYFYGYVSDSNLAGRYQDSTLSKINISYTYIDAKGASHSGTEQIPDLPKGDIELSTQPTDLAEIDPYDPESKVKVTKFNIEAGSTMQWTFQNESGNSASATCSVDLGSLSNVNLATTHKEVLIQVSQNACKATIQ